MYWFTLLIALALQYSGVMPFPENFHFSPAHYITANLSMFAGQLHVPFAVGVFWTLGWELFYYFTLSIFLCIGFERRTVLLGWIANGVFAVFAIAVPLTVHKYPAFLVELWCLPYWGACIYRWSTGEIKTVQFAMVAGAACVLECVGFALNNPNLPVLDIKGAVIPSAVAICMIGVAIRLRHREVPWLLLRGGQISYSIYLLHCVWLWSFYKVFPSGLLTVCIVIVGSILSSELTFRLIELPGIAIGRAVSGRIARRPALAAVSPSHPP